MSGLRIARGFALPLDAVTKTFGILAQRRKGKTYTASVMAEEMVAAGIPWVALDPTGAWWGLRAGADGSERGGLEVYVFGGDHGDLPLERTAGRQIADLVIENPGHYVLDFSHLESKEAERQFGTDFAERFYRRKGKAKDPMHLFVDEADLFVPQQSPSGDKRMVGAFESIVRRGGIRGIGTTLISQRAAVVNKNVLEQIDVLITLRVVGPNDRKAILKGYIEAHGDPKQQAAMLESLASLPLGEAWIWEPGADVFERIKIRKRRTFNSSATPDGRQVEVKGLAAIDLDALRGQLAATIERAKAEDPKELRRQIRALERQLSERPTEERVETVTETVEVPVVEDETLERLEEAIDSLGGAAGKIVAATNEISSALGKVAARRREPQPAPASRRPAEPPAPAPPPAADTDHRVTPAQQRILDALAALEAIGVAQANKTQLALFAEASPKSSGYTNNLGALRSAGLIAYPAQGIAALTDAGRAIADDAEAPRSHDELLAFVRELVGPARSRILDALVDVYPEALPKDELAERAGTSPTSSGYTNNLGSLRSLGLIDYPEPGYAAATPVLFLEAA